MKQRPKDAAFFYIHPAGRGSVGYSLKSLKTGISYTGILEH